MSTTQQTLSQLDQPREAEQNHAEAPLTIQEIARPLQSDHAMEQKRIRENRTRTYIPDRSLQEAFFENEAIERWLDDGGTEGRRWAASKSTR